MDPGSVASVAGLLDQSIRLISKLRKAYKDAKGLPEALEHREKKLDFLLPVIQAAQDEEVLQTAMVILQLQNVSNVVGKINDCLKTLARESSDRNAVTKVWHQLKHGREDTKTLDDLMDDLDDAKTNLGLVIQLTNIGLVKSHEDPRIMLADPEVITQVDRVVVGVFGEGGGLQLAKLIQGRPRRDDGRVAVDEVELATLYDKATSFASVPQIAGTSQADPGRVERIIIANSALDESKMINAPLGEDMWKDVTVKIMNNKTSGSALMVNFPITMQDANQLMDRQDQKAMQDREERQEIRAYEERKHIREMEERKEIRETKERKANRDGG